MIMSYNSNVFQQISSKLINKSLRMAGALREAAKLCAEDLLRDSEMQVPVDTGALVLSGEVVDKGNSFDVVYSATQRDRHLLDPSKPLGSNPDFNYALIQHEATWFKHPNGGKDHYLSDPYNANKQTYMEIMKESVREAVLEDAPINVGGSKSVRGKRSIRKAAKLVRKRRK